MQVMKTACGNILIIKTVIHYSMVNMHLIVLRSGTQGTDAHTRSLYMRATVEGGHHSGPFGVIARRCR